MAIKKAPAFQFYAGDFLIGVASMPLAERGAYITLLAIQWSSGSVPGDDPAAMGRILGVSKAAAKAIWLVVGDKFQRGDDGQWRNERLEDERVKQAKFRLKQSGNGKASAEARSKQPNVNGGSTKPPTVVKPSRQPKSNSSSSSSSSEDPSKNDGSASAESAHGHPISELLAFHELCFSKAMHGEKPAKYTKVDAKHAKEMIARHGYDKARLIVRQAFVSKDKFISDSGRSVGFIASSNVQNRLITELANVHQMAQPQQPQTLREIDEMEAKRRVS